MLCLMESKWCGGVWREIDTWVGKSFYTHVSDFSMPTAGGTKRRSVTNCVVQEWRGWGLEINKIKVFPMCIISRLSTELSVCHQCQNVRSIYTKLMRPIAKTQFCCWDTDTLSLALTIYDLFYSNTCKISYLYYWCSAPWKGYIQHSHRR